MQDGLRERLTGLEAKVAELKDRARRLRRHAGPPDTKKQAGRRAVVDRTRCTGCGLCEQVCPSRAVRVTYIANVDARRCTGCGTCVPSCPHGAVRLTARPAKTGAHPPSA